MDTNATLNITGTGSKTMDALPNFSVSGTVNWDGAGPIVFKNGSSFEMGGTFNVTGGGTMQDGGGGTNSFDNVGGGKFIVKPGAANTVTIHVKFTDVGANVECDVDSGTLLVDGGSDLNGKIIVDNAAQLTLASTNPKVDALDGVTIITGTTVFLGHVTVLNDSSLETTVLDKSVLLDGARTLSIGADYEWFGNGPWSGSGQMIVTGLGGHLKLDVAGQAAYPLGRTIDNLGMVTWSQRDISVSNAANIINEDSATYDIQVDKNILNGGGAGTFQNKANATLQKSAGNGTTRIDIITLPHNDGKIRVLTPGRIRYTTFFINLGIITIEASQGGLDFAAGFEQDAGGSTAIQASNASITVSGGDFALKGGTVSVVEGDTISVTGNYLQTGGSTTLGGPSLPGGSISVTNQVVVSSGTLELSVGTLTATNGVVINSGGILQGTGQVYGALTNAGTINPGDPGVIGNIGVSGSYTQTSTGILNMDVGGSGSNMSGDQLNVSGLATLAGTINVLTPGSIPYAGSFELLTWGSRSGAFATVNLPGTGHWSYSYDDTSSPYGFVVSKWPY